jgi:hypothetical protein
VLAPPLRVSAGTAEGGGGGGRALDGFKHVRHVVVLEDVDCGYAQHANALLREPGIAARVVLSAAFVADAVDLHGEPSAGAEEVEDVGADGMLTAEDETVQLTSTQFLPEQDFGQGHLAAKSARALLRQN